MCNHEIILVLKSLFNTIEIKLQYEKNYFDHPANSLTKDIARAKIHAYKDCLEVIQGLLIQYGQL